MSTDKALQTKFPWARAASFALGNGLAFAAFSWLWAAQYRMPEGLFDRIDSIVDFWVWVGCFFTVSLCTLRGRLLTSVLISAASAMTFAFALLLFVNIILAPIFDPWW